MKYSVDLSSDELFELISLVAVRKAVLTDRIADDEVRATRFPVTHPVWKCLDDRSELCNVDTLLNILQGALNKGGEADEC